MSRDETVKMLREAADGKREVHVWSGSDCPWIRLVVALPGAPVDGTDQPIDAETAQKFEVHYDGLPPPMGIDIIEEFGVYYAGVLIVQEVQVRLNELETAERLQER